MCPILREVRHDSSRWRMNSPGYFKFVLVCWLLPTLLCFLFLLMAGLPILWIHAAKHRMQLLCCVWTICTWIPSKCRMWRHLLAIISGSCWTYLFYYFFFSCALTHVDCAIVAKFLFTPFIFSKIAVTCAFCVGDMNQIGIKLRSLTVNLVWEPALHAPTTLWNIPLCTPIKVTQVLNSVTGWKRHVGCRLTRAAPHDIRMQDELPASQWDWIFIMSTMVAGGIHVMVHLVDKIIMVLSRHDGCTYPNILSSVGPVCKKHTDEKIVIHSW